MAKTALLIIDMQNDFCPPSGSLAVSGGTDIIQTINNLRRCVDWDMVVLSKDWHAPGHVSFASTHSGTQVFTPHTLADGSVQMMWPDHCVQGSFGSEIHADIERHQDDVVVLKGTHLHADSYSAFFDNNHVAQTELDSVLKSSGISRVICTGLAYDYCVGFTALDAKSLGYETFVVEDATRGVAPESTASMVDQLVSAGVTIISSKSISPDGAISV